jgi:hypothetical protein
MGPVSGLRTSRTEPEGNPWSGHDRNKCTLQAWRPMQQCRREQSAGAGQSSGRPRGGVERRFE